MFRKGVIRSLMVVCVFGSITCFFAMLLITPTEGFNLNYKYIPKYYGWRQCEDKQSLTLLNNVTYQLDSDGGTIWSGVVDFLAPIKDLTKLAVTLHRCSGGVSPNLCEYYTHWIWTTAVCSMVSAKGMLWTPLAEAFEPPFKCPVPATRRIVTNGSLDIQTALAMGVSNAEKYIWDVEVELFNEKNLRASCVRFYVEALRVRINKLGKIKP
ncbi:uncharacterized protein LOC113210245 [Frankliniella occidentalis]|uniref:Uncharacterized protein LOC113210245 n=1 Tax=Frankliniella occidentalis TaxID=133901 RepID=A0A9C6TXZ8_FRAOC|nr:uncharacterized protein LOC113210245 [Frankliniella occidentalis]XP_052124455.1 uncharacterized protein LOC113210245 [Frankliniella occidentalis]XP_052124456.1 uncharacterized protein LOC113210245 [Frankliniella occidentalis]